MMNYNIRNAKGLDGVTNYQRIANVINKAQPDVVALQEVDSVTNRSAKVDVLRKLANETLMYPTYAAAISYDGGKYGLGVLSKVKPLRSGSFELPGREEARTFLWVEFEDYIYCCTHFSLNEEDRMGSLEAIYHWAGEQEKPFFVAGDLNAEPDSDIMSLAANFGNILTNPKQNTYPSDKPNCCIDYIIANKFDEPLYTVVGSRVIPEAVASDHRPLLVDLIWKQPAASIFRTKPYLQNPVGGGITVMWSTTVPTSSWVAYGTDPAQLNKKARLLVDGQAIANNLNHKIRLTGLDPGKKYYYRVHSQEMMTYQAYSKKFGETAVSELASFTLPDAKSTDFTAIIFNDLHKQEATLKALHKQVKDMPCDFVVFNGDCIDDPRNEADALQYISECNNIVGADHIPVFYLRGNHEIRNAFSIGLRDLFDYVGDKTYGAFSWGDTRVVMLDCGEDKPDDHWVYYGLNDFSGLRQDQVLFLEKEVKTKAFKKAEKRVLIHHIPVYGAPDKYNPCLELWDPILKKAPFNVAINGHMHEFSYHPKGSAANNFPIVVGGGPSLKNGTVMILQKQGAKMTLKVLDTEGKILLDIAI
jgi:endonuclease/exonuclease/phosphatase family metal-dependent hydrolase/Icc-related predicted phosphoesterase